MTDDRLTGTAVRWANNPVVRMLIGLVGLALAVGALYFLMGAVNATARVLGYGDPIQVEVTEGGVGSSPGRDGRPAEGIVLGDGRTVLLYDARPGDIVTARPQLLGLPGKETVYHGWTHVTSDFVHLIGFLGLGIISTPFLLLAFAPRRPNQSTHP